MEFKKSIFTVCMCFLIFLCACQKSDNKENQVKTQAVGEKNLETDLQHEILNENLIAEESGDVQTKETIGQNDETNIFRLQQGEVMETTFFDFSIRNITRTDTVAEYTANDGMIFWVLDVSLTNVTEKHFEVATGSVPMYASDFCLYLDENMENGVYPASTGILEELPKEYELEDYLEGKLIFLIPSEYEHAYLVYEEYVSYGSVEESQYANTWMMEIGE